MAVTVVVPGVLRAEADGQGTLQVEVGGSSTVAAVLDDIAERWPRLARRIRDERGDLRRYVNLYVDGEECRRLDGLATAVPDRAEILIVPSVAGG
jgi:molybdopterin synthase sulfur carrier subunit